MLHAIEGKLLYMLKSRDDHESLKLVDSLETVCKVVEPFIDALPHQGGSLTGVNHTRGIVHEIENLISGSDNLSLNSAEIYILLVAVLTHDIGKLDEDDTREKKSRIGFENYAKGVAETLDLELSGPQKESLKKKPHPLISAYELLLHPTKFALFDKELASLVAIVAFSHCEGFKENDARDCAQKLIEDKYLAHYGKIRIGWLCALLTIGDELDTSYHRALPTEATVSKPIRKVNSRSSKGEFRSNIGGCRIDLVGRCIIVYTVGDLKQLVRECQTKDSLYQNLAGDVFGKNRILKAWETELMQMYINVQACLVEVDGHLLKVTKKTDDQSLFYMVPAVEPAVNNFKVSRIIEAMFKLKYGVFKKKYFSWEMLQSESGFESQQELKLIVHRISRLAQLFSYPTKHKFICLDEALPEGVVVPFSLDIQDLDLEWTIKAEIVSDINPSESQCVLDYSIISSWFLFFIDSIVSDRDLDVFWKRTGDITKTWPGKSDSFSVQVAKGSVDIRHFFVHPGNESLTYLLDEVTPCPSTAPRGIELPKLGALYIQSVDVGVDNKSLTFNPRLLGMNLVIAGPPGIGKSTLALDIISNLSLRGCDGSCEKTFACNRVIANTGAVAYFSLEQPIFTIKNLAIQLGYPDPDVSVPGIATPSGGNLDSQRRENGNNPNSEYFTDSFYNENFHSAIKILESQPLGTDLSGGDESSDDGEAEYIKLFPSSDNCRVLLLPRLSPRFVGEQTATNERKLFWQRFKQISRLIESSVSVTEGNPFHPMRLHAIVIDNINSFLNEPMAREYIFKLFRLISFSGLLGIYILEDPGGAPGEKHKEIEEVQFLSDIWIELDWAEKLNYKMKMFEVKKSRYQRHVFGAHPFKIRFKEDV